MTSKVELIRGEAKLPKSSDLTNDDIEFIQANTDLSRDKILKWYDEFTAECPTKKLDRSSFTQFYSKLIPDVESTSEKMEFSEWVFGAFDTDRNGYIDFAEFLLAFWVRARGSLKDKLNWLFDVYDTDKSGYIGQYELAKALRLIFAMKGINESDANERTRRIFAFVDRNTDGRISKQEFVAGCTRDETIRQLLAPF